jgi:quercetin dioxygenase-like cupin family protein
MKHITKTQAIERKNSDICTVIEYPSGNQDLDFAIVNISGKYPEKGYAKNLISSEVVYVQSGEGQVTVDGQVQELQAGDVVHIEPHEQFVWEGNLQLFIACHPAFTPEQHEVVANNM